MAKVRDLGNGNYQFKCLGCQSVHSVSTVHETARENSDGRRPLWVYNGNPNSPTFQPSVNYVSYCHFFVEDGMIRYLEDCQHEYAGRTIELPDMENDI